MDSAAGTVSQEKCKTNIPGGIKEQYQNEHGNWEVINEVVQKYYRKVRRQGRSFSPKFSEH